MEKIIKNIGKVCTNTTCKDNSFPYCLNGCIFAKMEIEYEEVNENNNDLKHA